MPEAIAQKKLSCLTCRGEVIQKCKARLIVVGLCMIAAITIAFVIPLFWATGILLVLMGVYILIWATLGKACWCRNCKKFSISG
ncbi:MAG: hypothetical protein U1F83_12775 [Verrucomicrobiota bacterium]